MVRWRTLKVQQLKYPSVSCFKGSIGIQGCDVSPYWFHIDPLVKKMVHTRTISVPLAIFFGKGSLWHHIGSKMVLLELSTWFYLEPWWFHLVLYTDVVRSGTKRVLYISIWNVGFCHAPYWFFNFFIFSIYIIFKGYFVTPYWFQNCAGRNVKVVLIWTILVLFGSI